MATFAEVLQADLPDTAGEDSFSLLPLLKGEDKPVRETSVSCSIRGVPSVRNGRWKYIAAPGSGGWGKGGDQSQPLQLYLPASETPVEIDQIDIQPATGRGERWAF